MQNIYILKDIVHIKGEHIVLVLRKYSVYISYFKVGLHEYAIR